MPRRSDAGDDTLPMLRSINAAAFAAPADDPIYVSIFDAIQDGKLPPGTKLGEDQLAAVFQVSRTRIRQSLRQLAFAGVVEMFKNRGAFVARPTRRDANDIYAARRLVEADVVTMVALHHTPADLAALRAHVASQKAALAGDDRGTARRLIAEFHLVLAALAGNRSLARFIAQLVAQTTLINMLYDTREAPLCSVDEHEALVDRIAARDAAGSVAMMTEHLQAVERRLRFPDDRPPAVDFTSVFARG